MLKKIWIYIYHANFCSRKVKKYISWDERICSCGKVQKRVKGVLYDTWK